jgi:acetylornithine deacetylase
MTQDLADVTELLARLVAIPSVNPRGLAPHADATGERDIADFVLDWCAERGIEASEHDALPGRPNVVAVVPGRTTRTVVLEAHTDTVEVAGMTVDPFGGEVREGRLYGRGACDTKGSLAAFMLVLEALAAAPEPAPVTVVLAAVADEEHHYRGVTAFLEQRPELDYVGAIVGEPTELVAGIAHKGVVRFTAHVEGRSGHSSRPTEARSAVVMAMDVVRAIEQSPGTDAEHPLLGGATRTVVRIAGGEGPNVVPGHCEIDVDRRTLPGEEPLEVVARIARELDALHPGAVRLDDPFVVDYALDTAPDAELVVALTGRMAAHGLDARPVGLSFCSDASKFDRAGIPAVVLGPGSIGDAHTPDESVALSEVALVRDLVLETIDALGATA